MHILPPLHRLSRRASTPAALPLLGARDAARTLVPTSGSRCPTLVYSARRSQVCCALLPVLGFISFPAVRTRTAALTAGLSTATSACASVEPWHIAAFPAMLLPSEELPSMSAVPRLRGPSLHAVHPPTLAPVPDRSVPASIPLRRSADDHIAAVHPAVSPPRGGFVGLRASSCTGRAHHPSLLAQRTMAPDCSGPSSLSASRLRLTPSRALRVRLRGLPRSSSPLCVVAVASRRTPCPFHGLYPSNHEPPLHAASGEAACAARRSQVAL
jgi:hypothetical protein